MSEIQRYEAVNGEGIVCDIPQCSNGSYCLYTDLLWYQRKWIVEMVISRFFIMACALLAGTMVYDNYWHGPVAVPMGAGEKADLLKEVNAAKMAKEQAQADLKKARADYAASQAFFAGRAKELEGKIARDIQSLESPAARVQEIDRLNKEQAQRMSTHQGLVLEAKRVLGVENVQIVER